MFAKKIFGVLAVKDQLAMGDVRQLSKAEQILAYCALLQTNDPHYVKPDMAMQILGLSGDDAARFEKLRGKTFGLMFDESTCTWKERNQWMRRVR